MNKASLFRNGYVFFLVLIALTLPTKWMQLNSILILCLLGWYLITPGVISRLAFAFTNPTAIALVAIYIVYLISMLYTENLSKGFSHLETRFSILVLPVILLSHYTIDKRILNIILLSFFGGCVFSSLVCLVSTVYVNQLNNLDFTYYNSWYYSSDNLVKLFGFHPSYFSIYCSFCICIVIHFFNEKKVRAILAACFIIYLILFQLLLAARGGILATICICVVTVLYQAYRRNKIWQGILFLMVFGTVMIVTISQFTIITDKFKGMFNYEIHEYNKRFKLDRRFEKWESSAILFLRHPMLGLGIGDSRDELQKVYKEKGYAEVQRFNYDSHDLLLETAISIGILGVLALFANFYVSFSICIRKRSMLYLQFLILFFLLSLPEATLSVQKGVVFFAFFNTLFVAHLTGMTESKSQSIM